MTDETSSAPPGALAGLKETHNKTTGNIDSHNKSVKSRFDVGDKFDFIAAVAAMPANRNKRRPLLNATDFAVVTTITQRCNAKIGYAWCSARRIADEIDAAPSTITRSINKLVDLGILVDVTSTGRATKAKALRPAWERLSRTISPAGATSGAGYTIRFVNEAIACNSVNEAMPATLKGSERNVNEVNEIQGASAPASAKASRRSRAKVREDPSVPDADEIFKAWKGRANVLR